MTINIETAIEAVNNFAGSFKIEPITNKESLNNAINTVSIIKDKIKKLESFRKESTEYLVKQKKVIDNKFKIASEPLERIEREYKIIIQRYWDEENKKALALLQEAKKDTTIVSVVEAPQSKMVSDLGTASINKVWDFEIVNEQEIPRQYLCVDETKIREAIREGKREIQGINIFQKTQVAIR